MEEPRRILIIEDNSADVESVRRALKEDDHNTKLGVIRNGLDAQNLIEEQSVPPEDGPVTDLDLVLLDLKVPGVDGRNLIQVIRDSHGDTREVPVVILTTSNNRDDVRHAYREGANAYVMKPSDMSRFLEVVDSILNYWLSVVHDPETDGR